MGNFIENPPQISRVETIIRTRYATTGTFRFIKDLFLTVYFYPRSKREYIIHNDVNYSVERIKELIDSRLDSEDLMIIVSDRSYLYLDIGRRGSIRVTGRRLYPNTYYGSIDDEAYID